MNLNDALTSLIGVTGGNRSIRLRLWSEQGFVNDLLLAKHVSGVETICGGVEYRLLCVAAKADLPLKQFIAMPAELQFVTSAGALRSVCGIVDSAEEGEADGGLATYQLIMRDALAINEKGCNTRIFRSMNEVDITNLVLADWCRDNPVLARAFAFETWRARATTLDANSRCSTGNRTRPSCAACGSGAAWRGFSSPPALPAPTMPRPTR